MIDFFETDAGQFIAGAHRYILAARALRYSDEAKTRGEALKTPVLHLLAHGMELLFKFPLLQSGLTQKQVRAAYGHDLQVLWSANANAALRREALVIADQAWATARDSGKWKDDNFDADPRVSLEKAVKVLARLHGVESSFALRYTLSEPTMAPRPAFLIDVFGELAERIAKNPSYLDRTIPP